MLQPKVSELLTGNETLNDQGFLARCLIAAPDRTVGTRTYKDLDLNDHQVIRNYRHKMRTILDVEMPMRAETNELSPRAIGLSATGTRLWVLYLDHVEREMNEGGEFFNIRGFACKAAEQALRVAGVLALADNLDAGTIGEDFLDAGIKLLQFMSRITSWGSSTAIGQTI